MCTQVLKFFLLFLFSALFEDYSIEFTLIKEWSNELLDSSSDLYRELGTNITKWVSTCIVTGCRLGISYTCIALGYKSTYIAMG